jgi:tellurite resistance protein
MTESDLSPQEALVYIMLLVSAADRDMTDAEFIRIGAMVHNLPIFRDFDDEWLIPIAEQRAQELDREDGLDHSLAMSVAALPERLHETAYALSLEVAAADLKVEEEEMRILEMIRDSLDLDRLNAAAIERGVRARHMTV